MTTDWTTRRTCYQGERTVVIFTQITGSRVYLSGVRIGTRAVAVVSTFVPANRILRVDISDLIGLSTGNGECQFRDLTTQQNIVIQWTAVSGERPEYVVHPTNDYSRNVRVAQGSGAAFGLPSVMIEPKSGEADVNAEIYAPNISNITINGDEEVVLTNNTALISAGTNRISVYATTQGGDVLLQTIKTTPQTCGLDYARVGWTSRCDNYKEHIFEIAALGIDKNNNTDLQEEIQAGLYGFRQQSGEAVSATLALRGCTSYDLWYYSDILRANPTVIIGDVSFRAYVSTKKIDIPMSETDRYDLEIDMTLTQYPY